MFEDSLYALKTAKAAGFYTVGVYDADGESDQAGLKAAADLYVKELGRLPGGGKAPRPRKLALPPNKTRYTGAPPCIAQ